MDPQDVAKLRGFIDIVRAQPDLMHTPELLFFKNYLESLGAKVPAKPDPDEAGPQAGDRAAASEQSVPKESAPTAPAEVESEESDVELDESEVMEEDDDLNLEMGDSNKEASESDEEKLSEIRGQAQEAASEGNFEEALKLWTEAIKVKPQGAVLFAKRAQVLLKMNKPKNAIKDASKAIELNPDQPLAYRIRGRAESLLGNWEEAASDLNTSLKIDYSEEANDWLKSVASNAKKLHDHKRKYERKRQEKELKERAERVRRAQEEHQKARSTSGFPGGMPGGFPGGMPGGFPGAMPSGEPGAMPSGMQDMLGNLLKDPEILSAFSDPEVAAAFQDISANPANMMKYQSNPKVMALMNKMFQKVGR